MLLDRAFMKKVLAFESNIKFGSVSSSIDYNNSRTLTLILFSYMNVHAQNFNTLTSGAIV
jgi:hypothetical protein